MLRPDRCSPWLDARARHFDPELVALAFHTAGLDNWRDHVRQDPKFFRPAEVDLLIGDASKARDRLGWRPEVDFSTLVGMMVEHDFELEAKKAGIAL